MFCLRNWISLLIFLTNASPIYVLFFLLGTYILQRPCVYCSILLFVLVFSLFDFHADWFEPRWQLSSSAISTLTDTTSSLLSGNATITQALGETASIAISALNGTGGSLASSAMEGVRRRVIGGPVCPGGGSMVTNNGFEWLRGLLEKRQLRIPCVDVSVRL